MNIGHFATMLRAIEGLRPAGALDPLLVDALNFVLGFRADATNLSNPNVNSQEQSNASVTFRPVKKTESETLDRTDLSPEGAIQKAGAENTNQFKHLEALPSVLEQIEERADLTTPQIKQNNSLIKDSAARTDVHSHFPPLESLFAPHRIRAILRELSTLEIPCGKADILAAVKLISQGSPIEKLPQRTSRRLGHVIQLLVDTGPTMLPFALDKQQFTASAFRLFGRDRIRIADFIGEPLSAVRVQRQVRWQSLRWPPRQSTIIVISDFGIGSGETVSELRSAEWIEFLDKAHRQDIRTVALIPFEQTRWPSVAHFFGTSLTWDLVTGIQDLRRISRARSLI